MPTPEPFRIQPIPKNFRPVEGRHMAVRRDGHASHIRVNGDNGFQHIDRHPDCQFGWSLETLRDGVIWFGGNTHGEAGDIVAFIDTQPAPTTPPPIITSPGSYRTREGKRMGIERNTYGEFIGTHPWRGEDGYTRKADGGFSDREDTPSSHDIIGPWTEPTRLSLAKAALEEARAKERAAFYEHLRSNAAMVHAERELAAAESEAAQLAAIPPALLDVARHVVSCDPAKWNSIGVVDLLARSHSVDPAVLRAAMGAGK